jgi:hypothetical protein
MTLRCYKSRIGFAGNIVYQYSEGKFNRQDLAAVPEVSKHAAFADLLRRNPGITATDFEKLACKNNLGRNAARNWINEGVAIREDVTCERGPKNRSRYTLRED